MEDGAPAHQVGVVLTLLNERAFLAGFAELIRQERSLQWTQITLRRICVYGEGLDGVRRPHGINAEFIRRKRKTHALALRFRPDFLWCAGRFHEGIGGEVSAPHFCSYGFANGRSSWLRLVAGQVLHQFLHPGREDTLAGEIAGEFTRGKVQQEQRAEAVIQLRHGRRFIGKV